MLRITIFCISLVFAIGQVFAQAPSKGLVAHYLFNNDLKDSSKKGNHGVGMGGVAHGEDRFGSACGALVFDGQNDYVVVKSSNSLRSPRQELSVAVWFKLDKGAGDLRWLTICCKSDLQDETVNSPQYRMQATKVTLSVNTDFTENLKQTIPLDTWQHYTMVYDGLGVKAYLNGKKVFSFPYSTPFTPNDMPLEIGRDVPGVLEHFSGSMDDLRIYNRGLSPAEVQAIFKDDSERTANKPCPNTAPKPPVVKITRPNNNPHTSADAVTTITANIKNISSKSDIVFKLNGKSSTNFQYDKKKKTFSTQINLERGSNQIEIIATNKAGSDKDNGIINYEPTQQQQNVQAQPPSVDIVTPSQSPHNATTNTQRVVAQVQHIQNRNQIAVRANGKALSKFDFDATSGKLSFDLSLITGNNIVEITATNKDGEANDMGIIIAAVARPKAPTVDITTPANSPYQAVLASIDIAAQVRNVAAKNELTFKINGKASRTFDFDANTGKFHAQSVALVEGYNMVELTAKNNAGSDSDNAIISYQRQAAPPKVTIQTPAANPFETEDATTTIQASIEHVARKNEITFLLNGTPSTDFEFDAATGTFTAQTALQKGANVYEIIATNADGRDQASGQIQYAAKNPRRIIFDEGLPPSITVKEEFELGAPEVTLTFFDHRREDGDIVSIILNGKVLVHQAEIKKRTNGAIIRKIAPLEIGKEYHLISKAWNTGEVPPNTLTLEIDDGVNPPKEIILEADAHRSESVKFVYRGG